jgi:uncharacterized protein YoxC
MAVTVKGESRKEELSTEEALEKRVESLNKMEADIKAKCDQLDKTAANLSAREASLQETFDQREKELSDKLEKRKQDLDKVMGLTQDSDLFLRFYENVNQIYTIWCASKGSSVGLIESIQKILDARESIRKDEV